MIYSLLGLALRAFQMNTEKNELQIPNPVSAKVTFTKSRAARRSSVERLRTTINIMTITIIITIIVLPRHDVLVFIEASIAAEFLQDVDIIPLLLPHISMRTMIIITVVVLRHPLATTVLQVLLRTTIAVSEDVLLPLLLHDHEKIIITTIPQVRSKLSRIKHVKLRRIQTPIGEVAVAAVRKVVGK